MKLPRSRQELPFFKESILQKSEFLPTPQELALAHPNALFRITKRGTSLNGMHDRNELGFRQ
jgi:hypothetical protein